MVALVSAALAVPISAATSSVTGTLTTAEGGHPDAAGGRDRHDRRHDRLTGRRRRHRRSSGSTRPTASRSTSPSLFDASHHRPDPRLRPVRDHHRRDEHVAEPGRRAGHHRRSDHGHRPRPDRRATEPGRDHRWHDPSRRQGRRCRPSAVTIAALIKVETGTVVSRSRSRRSRTRRTSAFSIGYDPAAHRSGRHIRRQGRDRRRRRLSGRTATACRAIQGGAPVANVSLPVDAGARRASRLLAVAIDRPEPVRGGERSVEPSASAAPSGSGSAAPSAPPSSAAPSAPPSPSAPPTRDADADADRRARRRRRPPHRARRRHRPPHRARRRRRLRRQRQPPAPTAVADADADPVADSEPSRAPRHRPPPSASPSARRRRPSPVGLAGRRPRDRDADLQGATPALGSRLRGRRPRQRFGPGDRELDRRPVEIDRDIPRSRSRSSSTSTRPRSIPLRPTRSRRPSSTARTRGRPPTASRS